MRFVKILFSLALLCTIVSSCKNHNNDKTEQAIKALDHFMADNNELKMNQPDSIIHLLNQKQSEFNDSILWYFYETYKANVYFYSNQDNAAIDCCNRVSGYLNRTPPSYWSYILKSVNSNHRGVMMQILNQKDSAITCFMDALNALEHTEKGSKNIDICINIADTYRHFGKLPESSNWYRKALYLTDSLNENGAKHSIYMGLGQIYTDLENYELAQDYFVMADTLFPPQSQYEQYFFYNTRGNCYFFEKKYAEALECFKNAYQITQSFKYPFMNALVEANLGETNMLLEEMDSATYYLNRSYDYFSNQENTGGDVLFYMHGLLAAKALAEDDLKEANYYLSKPYDPSQIGPTYQYIYHKRLLDYYRKKGDYNVAFIYQDMVDLYDDSLRNANQRNRIAEVEFRHRQDTTVLQRNLMIIRKEAQISRLRIIIIGGAFLVLAIIIAIIAFVRYNKQKQERMRQQQVELITKLRMENVRNRFSPHFIFNVLNLVISSLKEKEEVMDPIKLLIQILRSNLLVCDKMSIPMDEELEMVGNFIALRQCMSKDAPQIKWNIDPKVDMQLQIPVMCIQIPVENAIKHAFPEDGNIEHPEIEIAVSKADAVYYKIQIADNGVGYGKGRMQQNAERNDSTGTGLRILYRTIELLNKYNEHPIHFEMEDSSAKKSIQHGTCITILIPKTYNYDI